MFYKQFTNKIIFITGATGYVGKSLSYNFASLGAELVLTDLKLKNLIKLKKELQKKYKININIKECDLSKVNSVNSLIKWIKKNFRLIDFFIHNASNTGNSKVLEKSRNLQKQTSFYWDNSMSVNLKSSFEITKNIYKILENSKNPAIVNISSIYGFIAPDWKIYKSTNMVNPAAYSASKSGLIQFTKWLASYLSPKIRVNSVSPGGIKRGQNKKFLKSYISKTLLKRMATEKDVVNAVMFLCSDLSSYITGQNLIVDGGYTLT